MYPPAAIDLIRAAIQKIKNHSGSALVVNAQTKRMDTARELLLNSDIEATDYRIIKDQCNEKITRLEARLSDLNAENHAILDIRPIAEEAMNSLRLLDEFYEKTDVEGKRYLVGMLYPEKLTFDGVMYRTPSMNLATEPI